MVSLQLLIAAGPTWFLLILTPYLYSKLGLLITIVRYHLIHVAFTKELYQTW